MAADDPANAEPAGEAGGDLACRPCRGTGSLISNLGGSPSTVECPWCEGRGRFIPEHDAQAKRKAAAASAPADDEPAD